MKQSEGPQIELSSLKTERGNYGSSGSTYTDSFNPDDYESIRLRRMFGYLIDVICIAIVTFAATIAANIIGVLSFGTLTPLLVLGLALIPVLYNTILIGGSWNATIGMRFMNVKMELLDGSEPDYLTAFIHAVLFYLSVAVTSSLILLVSLFNPRGRCLHDFIVGVVIRRTALS
ncbi:MAG: RDD family protein [Proteobacteria bacterium]|nr:RDD family protein [Pseudomonadota bacterium]